MVCHTIGRNSSNELKTGEKVGRVEPSFPKNAQHFNAEFVDEKRLHGGTPKTRAHSFWPSELFYTLPASCGKHVPPKLKVSLQEIIARHDVLSVQV